VEEAIVQLLDAIVKVAHTTVDTEGAQKLQTFFDIFWQRNEGSGQTGWFDGLFWLFVF